MHPDAELVNQLIERKFGKRGNQVEQRANFSACRDDVGGLAQTMLGACGTANLPVQPRRAIPAGDENRPEGVPRRLQDFCAEGAKIFNVNRRREIRNTAAHGRLRNNEFAQ